jgi:uncharacterized protein YcbK (DUF882 family)
MGDLSKNMDTSEWICHCGCEQLLIKEKLVKMMQSFRDRIGSPLTIHCVNRCKAHNADVGGKENSLHLTGDACDFHAPKLKTKELHAIALSSEDILTGGIGLYDTFLHVDIGTKRLWDNRT